MSKRKKLLLFGGVVFVGMVIGIHSLLRIMNQPSVGTLRVGQSNANETATNTAPATITTPYYTATLPVGYQIKRQTETPTNPLKLSSAFATGGQNNQEAVAITVGTVPSDGLSGIGDYNLRTSQSSLYQSVTLPGLPANARAFKTILGPSNICIIWVKGSLYNELVISSDMPDYVAQLLPVYSQILSTWQQK